MKRKKIAKYDIIKDVLYEWYIKCCQAGIYPHGAILQEDALKIKTELNDSNLRDFQSCNGWLEYFKKRFGLRQTRIVGEAGDYLKLPSRLGWNDFQKLFKAILLMMPGTWMN